MPLFRLDLYAPSFSLVPLVTASFDEKFIRQLFRLNLLEWPTPRPANQAFVSVASTG
ncbi:hypothetical protein PM082_020482 [Marasmius tenuissimus]|nr:hypothetical protein PM082_020482 [Marasmius tenuissimus]